MIKITFDINEVEETGNISVLVTVNSGCDLSEFEKAVAENILMMVGNALSMRNEVETHTIQ